MNRLAIPLAFALYALIAFALVGREIAVPGLYYDEVIQAQPAVELLRTDGEPSRIPGMREVEVAGRWIPLMTQSYMGALKSQLLVPMFAVFEANARTLRWTTLGWALVGVLLTMAWARRTLGAPEALLAGLLLCVDPSLLFIARHDWGSFSLALVCRAGALLLLTTGWRTGSAARLAAGGLCLGLGIYNKVDFAVSVAALGGALAIAAPARWQEVWRERRRGAAAVGLGLVVGAAPMLAAAAGAWAATRLVSRGVDVFSGDWPEKLAAMAAMLDGSYFQRLILAGGRFAGLAEVPDAVSSPVGVAFLLALTGLVALDRAETDPTTRRARRFVAAAGVLTLLGIWLTPRAVRIHHFLNAVPFPQLTVAAFAVAVWRGVPRQRTGAGRRAAVALAVVALVVGAVRVDLATLGILRETGGRGLWTGALGELGHDLESGDVVVSLDWGLDGPLRFAFPSLQTREPIWELRHRVRQPARVDRLAGTSAHVYLVHEPVYEIFPFGSELIAALETLPPGLAQVRRYSDRSGDPAFRAIRIGRDHELVYRRRGVEVRLR